MRKYYTLCGPDKKLNEIVMVGSHDAAIADGAGDQAQTQDLDIYGQSLYGARFFDLRVGAFTHKLGGRGPAELQSYHAAPILQINMDRRKTVTDVDHRADIRHTTLLGGFAGFGLKTMLEEARDFVNEAKTEFLIFKFDKSTNWPLIREACVDVLGDKIYKCYPNSGNLNKKRLEQLKGKVVILFTQEGWESCGVAQNDRSLSGILRWKNTYKKLNRSAGQYEDQGFDGLQYYGKGGVSHGASGETGKINMNADVQQNLMSGQGKFKTKGPSMKHPMRKSEKGIQGYVDPRVMGIMYWTTTSGTMTALQNIRHRNDKMWDGPHLGNLSSVWGQSYSRNLVYASARYAADNVQDNIDPTAFSSAGTLKAFTPNVIMIDYVDDDKCKTIMDLNTTASTTLTEAIRSMNQ